MSGQVSTIDDVIARMREIGTEAPPPDGVGYFNDLYLAVTEGVREGVGAATAALPAGAREPDAPLSQPDEALAKRRRIRETPVAPFQFENKQFIDELDVRFSNYYFEAYDANGVQKPSWSPLFENREKRRTPLQFALCGMNAHINHDLAVAIVETAERRNIEPKRHSPEHRDFVQVNKVLAAIEHQVKGEFVKGAMAEIDDALHDEPDKIAIWSIARARDVAWFHAEFLWKLRTNRGASKLYHGVLDELAKLAGNGILI